MAEKQHREPYVKMRIEAVRLVPQEAVLGGCKTSTTANGQGSGQEGCFQGGCPDNQNT